MIIRVSGTCSFEGCESQAEFIACGRATYDKECPGHPTPACYCREHMDEVADELFPEYIDQCPNCGCMFGVN